MIRLVEPVHPPGPDAQYRVGRVVPELSRNEADMDVVQRPVCSLVGESPFDVLEQECTVSEFQESVLPGPEPSVRVVGNDEGLECLRVRQPP